ncbi:MAG: sulfatase [Deltaproteobacteria bacterium]|nr:sulfatase [Deltaproteobacteria bacterium]
MNTTNDRRARGAGPGLKMLAFAALCAACGNNGGAPDARDASRARPKDGPVVQAARQIDREATETGITAAPAAAPAESALPRIFDFAAHLDQAHLRSGGLLVDFGTPSRHKHTLGDWKTGWHGDFTRDGVTFSYMSGNQARIFFEALPEEAGGGTITIRAKAVGSTRGRVLLNGVEIGKVEIPRNEFGHASVAFKDGIKPGRNEIMLRFDTRKPGHDGWPATMAVDYVRVSSGEGDGANAASAFDAVLAPAKEGKPAGIALAVGESLTFLLPIPEAAHLVGSLSSSGGAASLQVKIRVDGKTEPVARAIASPSQVDMDLSALSGEWAQITLAAAGGEVLLSGAGLVAPIRQQPPASGKPSAKNVIVLLIDTLRADHVSFGNPRTRVRTASLDEIGAESTVFERALAQENWTKPSVATLLTGLFPESHQTKSDTDVLPSSVVTAAEHFKANGFATAGFVANGYVSDKFGFKQGFDTWTNYVREGKPNRAQFVADDVIAWLKNRPKDKRFFMYVQTIDPHVPYMPPSKYRALYDDQPYNGPVDATNTAKLLEGIKTGAVHLNERDKFRLEALYDGEISYHDDHLARIVAAMAELGLADDTLLVVTADHGEEFFDHGSVGHGHSMYEELLHVPFVVRLPGAQAGKGARVAAEVGLVDVLPTACDILGIDTPEEAEGRSLVPLLAGATVDAWPQAAFSDFLGGQRVARSGRFKVIQRGMNVTLFDLVNDPKETKDVSSDHPIALAGLRDLLGQHEGRFVPVDDGSGKSKAVRHKAETTVIDPATKKQLQGLGYMIK